jgi:hypothetical protein
LDKRPLIARNGSILGYRGGPYNVSIMLRGVTVAEMNAGAEPVIGIADELAKPGEHIIELPCPRTRSTATVRIELTDANKLQYVDEFSLSFHMHFHRLLKWLIALPLGLMAAAVLGLKGEALPQLPMHEL